MAQVKTIIFKKACDDFTRLQTRIGKIKEKLKALNAENKGNVDIIKAHMEDNELSEYEVGGFTFQKKEVERCTWNEKNLEEIIDDQDILDRYREQFTETKKSFSMQRPKKRPRRGSPDSD
tara:strand:+ start:982 stop:1341 length:360 start_codon:yes stop_codon:yes gene_type:complete